MRVFLSSRLVAVLKPKKSDAVIFVEIHKVSYCYICYRQKKITLLDQLSCKIFGNITKGYIIVFNAYWTKMN